MMASADPVTRTGHQTYAHAPKLALGLRVHGMLMSRPKTAKADCPINTLDPTITGQTKGKPVSVPQLLQSTIPERIGRDVHSEA